MKNLDDMKTAFIVDEESYKVLSKKKDFTNEDMYCIMAGIVSRAPKAKA